MSEKAECPFCWSTNTFVERDDLTSAYVQCECGAQGPICCQDGDDEDLPGKDSAIRAWNTRPVNSVSDLVKALEEMVETFKPFTMRPVGAPGSSAREDQEHQIAVHSRAHAALSKYRGEA